MPVDAHPPSSRPILRSAALLLVCLGCFAAPAIAQADDLIQLNGDPPVTLSGVVSYGLLYLDGTVRLAGDTGINATDVFIGPDASLQTCYDIATDGNNCVNGRSLGITATGGVAISPTIDLRGAVGPNRAGGALMIHAARVTLGGGVETGGIAAPSGGITIDSTGAVVTQGMHAPGAPIFVHGAGGVSIGGDASSASGDPAVPGGGPIDLASSGGDVSVLGSISSTGRDGATAVPGGNAGAVGIAGGDVRVSGGIDTSPGRGVDGPAGAAGGIIVTARGGIVVSGLVNASGDGATTAGASDGAAITLSAAGGIVTGSLMSIGGGSAPGGRNGGPISVTAAALALGNVTTDAGDATSDPANGSGGAGGSVAINATGAVAVGAVSARGGSGRGAGVGGPGGSITVTGDGVTTGAITTLGENLSASGGARQAHGAVAAPRRRCHRHLRCRGRQRQRRRCRRCGRADRGARPADARGTRAHRGRHGFLRRGAGRTRR